MPNRLSLWTTGQGGVSQLIQSAEKLIAANNYQLALEQLATAQNLDPRNEYIMAIIDRVRFLQNAFQSHTKKPAGLQPNLSFGLQDQDEHALSSKALQNRIKQLTNIAEKYLEEDAADKAFDSLMKAFLLDPTSPYVTACEKSVLPAWEKKRSAFQMKNQSLPSGANAPSPKEPPRKDEQVKQARGQDQRLNKLLQQKQTERQEIERSRWREASGPPKVLDSEELKEALKDTSKASPPDQERGLFAKLKRGKFLK